MLGFARGSALHGAGEGYQRSALNMLGRAEAKDEVESTADLPDTVAGAVEASGVEHADVAGLERYATCAGLPSWQVGVAS